MTMRHYLPKDIVKNLVMFVFVAGLMSVTGGTGFLLIVPLALAAAFMRRTDKLFFYVLLITSMLISNGNIVHRNIIFVLAQRGLMVLLGGMMTIQLLGSRVSPYVRPLLGILPYVFFMIIPSAMGWNPKISFLKIFLFLIIFSAYLGVANQATQTKTLYVQNVRGTVLAVAIYFIAGSIALIPFPALSQLSGEEFVNNPNATSLFMGMTSQSQALGPATSCLAVILLGDLLFSIRRPDKLYLGLLLCCPLLIYKTSSRTGMGAFILGMMYMVFLFAKAHGIGARWRGKVMSWVGLFAVVVVVAGVAIPSVRASAVKFILKYSVEEGRLNKEDILASRQGKIDQCMMNFRKSPLIGNGFQVSEDMVNMGKGGLVLSAPVEKGTWVFGVLEEGGLIGLILFTGFLISALWTLAKRRAYIGSGCLCVCMLTNLGEFTFFSMTYMGGFVWAMVFAGIAMDVQRIRHESNIARTTWAWR